MGCNNSKEDVVTDNQAPTNAPAPSAQAPLDENHFASEIGFVIKTKKPGDQKVFINVFHHSCVLYVVTAEKPKFSTDRSGDPCLTYDCVISSAVQTMCSTNDEVKSYVSEQLIQFLNEKFSENLALDFKIPKMKRGFVGEDVPCFKNPDPDVTERLKTSRENNETKTNSVVAAAPVTPAVPLASNSGKTPESYPTKSAAPSSVPASVVHNNNTVSDDDSLPWCFAGYALKKSGSAFVGLQTRYFVLSDDGTIDYFQSEENYKQGVGSKGKINLENVDKDITSKKGFSLISAADPLLINIPVGGRMYEIHCETQHQSALWASIINKHIKRIEDDD